MYISNGSPKPFFIRNQPVSDLPGFPGQIVPSVMSQPEFSRLFVILHEQDAILFQAIQDEMDVIAHQAEADYDNGVVLSKPTQTQGDAVHTRNEFFDRSEQDVLLQPLRGEMIIMLAFHNSRFFKIKQNCATEEILSPHLYVFICREMFYYQQTLVTSPGRRGDYGRPLVIWPRVARSSL